MGAQANELRPADTTSGPTSIDGRAPRGWWFIYFYGTEDGSEVKIGRTKQRPSMRRLQHENDGGRHQPMRTLAVVLGQASDEAALKRYFKRWQSRTRSSEWIEAGEEMRGYLRWLRSQPYVAPGELELEALAPVNSHHWLPGEGRDKAPLQLQIQESDPWGDMAVDLVTEGDFYTHPRIIEAARAAMGGIDLDPASCREANAVVRAERFYGFRENGLLQSWGGKVWLNPPYGNWEEWVPKTLAEWNSGKVEQLCLICTSRVTTAQMFHPIVRGSDALVVMCGRLAFWGPNASAPDEGHAVFYFGENVDGFADAFALIGTTFRR